MKPSVTRPTGRRGCRRKGVVLAGVVFLMAIVLGLLSVMALSSGLMYRQQRVDRMRIVARAMTDSGAAYARAHPVLTDSRPAASQAEPGSFDSTPIELDPGQLLPPNLTGSLTLEYLHQHRQPGCRITAQVASGSLQVQDSLDIDLSAP